MANVRNINMSSADALRNTPQPLWLGIRQPLSKKSCPRKFDLDSYTSLVYDYTLSPFTHGFFFDFSWYFRSYFYQLKFVSFQRQLNLYGFKKMYNQGKPFLSATPPRNGLFPLRRYSILFLALNLMHFFFLFVPGLVVRPRPRQRWWVRSTYDALLYVTLPWCILMNRAKTSDFLSVVSFVYQLIITKNSSEECLT